MTLYLRKEGKKGGSRGGREEGRQVLLQPIGFKKFYLVNKDLFYSQKNEDSQLHFREAKES